MPLILITSKGLCIGTQRATVIQVVHTFVDRWQAMLKVVGAAIFYRKRNLMDKKIIPLKRFERNRNRNQIFV
jgi:hypothetical protein